MQPQFKVKMISKCLQSVLLAEVFEQEFAVHLKGVCFKKKKKEHGRTQKYAFILQCKVFYFTCS